MSSVNPFPNRLLVARKEAGISQRQLGIQVGIDPGSASSRMNHYEKGRHMPDYETLVRLAKELDKPVAYFFCEKGSVADLICLLEKLSETERQLLIDQINNKLLSEQETAQQIPIQERE